MQKKWPLALLFGSFIVFFSLESSESHFRTWTSIFPFLPRDRRWISILLFSWPQVLSIVRAAVAKKKERIRVSHPVHLNPCSLEKQEVLKLRPLNGVLATLVFDSSEDSRLMSFHRGLAHNEESYTGHSKYTDKLSLLFPSLPHWIILLSSYMEGAYMESWEENLSFEIG